MTPEWRSAADSLFQATGVTVSVMEFESGELLAGVSRCAHCHLVTDIAGPGPSSCFDAPPESDSGPARVMCRAGLPTLIAPVLRDGHPVAHVVVGGFVTSTRDRRRLWELISARGVGEDSVRLAVKSITVVSRAEAEGYLQVAVACARTVLDATAERLSSAERVEELRLFVTAGQQVVVTDQVDATSLGGIAEEAVSLVGGEAGAVLRPTGGFFEIVARTERWRGAVGTLLAWDETVAGRATSSHRTVVARSSSASGVGTLAHPLMVGGRVVGVLEVRLPATALPVRPERVARLDRFGRFIAIGLQREDERKQVERALLGYTQLNELAAALGGTSDVDTVMELVNGLVDTAFEHQIGGVVLSAWGKDHAHVTTRGDVTRADIDAILSEVAGRDVATHPFASSIATPVSGAIAEKGAARSDWALLTVDLEHGDLVTGYLFVARCDGGIYRTQDRALLGGIAAHAGAALGRVALFTHIRDDYAKTISALAATLDAGEHMPTGHSSRVMQYAMMIGEEMGLSYDDVEQLRFAGLLHDIGKTGLPSELLLKPSKLSAEELARVHAHAEIGASIVDQIEFLKTLTPIILHHHERWDGTGYPAGLKEDEIPLLARVLAVADSFDAMTTKSAYHKCLTIPQARKEMQASSGEQFDPRIVSALMAGLDKSAIAAKKALHGPGRVKAESNAKDGTPLPA